MVGRLWVRGCSLEKANLTGDPGEARRKGFWKLHLVEHLRQQCEVKTSIMTMPLDWQNSRKWKWENIPVPERTICAPQAPALPSLMQTWGWTLIPTLREGRKNDSRRRHTNWCYGKCKQEILYGFGAETIHLSILQTGKWSQRSFSELTLTIKGPGKPSQDTFPKPIWMTDTLQNQESHHHHPVGWWKKKGLRECQI